MKKFYLISIFVAILLLLFWIYIIIFDINPITSIIIHSLFFIYDVILLIKLFTEKE